MQTAISFSALNFLNIQLLDVECELTTLIFQNYWAAYHSNHG